MVRSLASGGFLWALLSVTPAFAFDYGLGSYGSGAYNIGQLDATTTVLISDTNPSTVGDSITLTATVTPSTATGTITFKNGATTIGTATLGHASGSLTTSALTAGSHALTAVYGGNVTHSGSTSNTVTQVVNAAASSSSSSASSAAGGGSGGGGGGGGGRGRTQPIATGPNASASSVGSSTAAGVVEALIDGTTVSFRDVPLTAWFAPYVRRLLESGIVSGYRDASGRLLGRYGPANPVTYAEIAKMALEASGTGSVSGEPRNRSARGHWAAAYIARAEALRLSVFTPALRIDTPATRGAVIQTLLEALGIPLQEVTDSPYTDLRRTHPHAKAILTATKLGILSGDTLPDGTQKGTVRPDDPVNRAEVAKMIVLALKAAGK